MVCLYCFQRSSQDSILLKEPLIEQAKGWKSRTSERVEIAAKDVKTINERLDNQADVIGAVLLTDSVVLKNVQAKRQARILSK